MLKTFTKQVQTIYRITSDISPYAIILSQQYTCTHSDDCRLASDRSTKTVYIHSASTSSNRLLQTPAPASSTTQLLFLHKIALKLANHTKDMLKFKYCRFHNFTNMGCTNKMTKVLSLILPQWLDFKKNLVKPADFYNQNLHAYGHTEKMWNRCLKKCLKAETLCIARKGVVALSSRLANMMTRGHQLLKTNVSASLFLWHTSFSLLILEILVISTSKTVNKNCKNVFISTVNRNFGLKICSG